jgi:hypothetical protein
MVVHASNHSTWEAETKILSLSQSVLHSKTLSQNIK